MRALRQHPPGGPDHLRLDDVERPAPGRGEVLVRVHAAAITRDELEWASDRLPAVPSYELSGVVAVPDISYGPDLGFAEGDEVIALTPFDRDGVAAECALVPSDVLARKPRSLDHVQAAALTMPGLTAWQALVVHGRLQPGERVAVTGARGGVGHVAVQLARARGAVLVGAGETCHVLLDTVGGNALTTAAAHADRVITIVEEVPGAHYFVVQPDGHQLTEITRLADAGHLQPQIDAVYPLTRAREAFDRASMRGKHGKVVLDLNT